MVRYIKTPLGDMQLVKQEGSRFSFISSWVNEKENTGIVEFTEKGWKIEKWGSEAFNKFNGEVKE